MAVRLRPQSSAWMAPHALAAQLTAQTGQIAGQGVAGLLGGIAQGVGAFTQARNRRQEMAINESRYKDALTRQDRSFQYGAAKDQASLLEDYMKGAEVEAALSAMSSPTGTPDPSKVQNLRTAQSSMNALRAQLAQIGGVQPANVPPMPEAPAPLTPTAQMPGVQERLAKLSSFEALSDEELGTVADGLAAEAEAIKAEMDAILKVGGTKGAAAAAAKRTAFAEKNREAMIAAGVLKRRQAKAEAEQKKADLEAQATKEVGVYADKQKIDESSDAARLAKINADRAAKGQPPIPDLALVAPTATGERQDKTLDFKRETIDKMERRAKWQAEFRRQAAIELENIRAANKEPAAQARALEAAKQEQKSRMAAAKNRYDTLRKMYDDNKELGVEFYGDATTPSAWDLYEAEREKYFAMTEAAQAPASAPAAAGGGDPMASAEEEYNNLPDAEKTPEAAARIAAKYGIK